MREQENRGAREQGSEGARIRGSDDYQLLIRFLSKSSMALFRARAPWSCM
jgi:hypothetical protein